jgi:hypothetical protein
VQLKSRLQQFFKRAPLSSASARWLGEAAAPKGKSLSIQSPRTLALIHTSPTLTPVFAAICSREIPEAQISHTVDESLIQETVRAGTLRKSTIRRLVS